MQGISVVIITLNEERNIARCLKSVKEIADEVLIVDSGSKDRTEEIATQMGAKVIQREWEGYSATKNFANSQAQYDYIFSIDADEALSPELNASILNAKATGLKGVYECNRLTNYCGKWIKHCGWYPDKKQRLFPKAIARWEGDYVHEEIIFKPAPEMSFLKGDLWHFSYHTVAEHNERIEKYSLLHAQKLHKENRKANVAHLLSAPAFKFIQTYLLRLGFLDGLYGYVISRLSARAVHLKYSKLKKLQQ